MEFFEYLLKLTGFSKIAEMSVNRIKVLESAIRIARDKYYAGTPVMTDMEFDTIEEELKKLSPDSPVLQEVGGEPTGKKIRHKIPMGSLNKAQSYSELSKWFKSLGNCGKLMVTDKLDGLSVDLRYEITLKQALTRGKDNFGEVITDNVSVMKGLPKSIPNFYGNIRGEIIITKEDHKRHFPDDPNPRNSAAGAAKRLDNSKAKFCTIICYRVYPDSGMFETKEAEFDFLKKSGFAVPNYFIASNVEKVESIYNDYIDHFRESLPYEIDGLVVEVNDNQKALSIGTDLMHPAFAIAYKFPHATGETTLRGIIPQTGKTGRVTPVGTFDPVNLAGAAVAKASLATYSFVRDMDLGPGDVIVVSRRNDVIPKIERVVKKSSNPRFKIPTKCPSCNSSLEQQGEYLVCPNTGICRAQVEGAALNWLKKIGVLEWGDAIMTDLHDSGMLNDISDLYKITESQLSEFVGRKRAKTMIDTLNSKKEIPLHIFVGSLGINGIGRTNAKAIVDAGFDSIEKMLNADEDEIAEIPNMGEIRASDFVSGIHADAKVISKLISRGVIPTSPKFGTLTGKSFCMTGFRDPVLADAIEAKGGVIKSSVGKGLTYLIQKDPNSLSEKTRKAMSYGTTIIGLDEARKLAL